MPLNPSVNGGINQGPHSPYNDTQESLQATLPSLVTHGRIYQFPLVVSSVELPGPPPFRVVPEK